MHAEHHLITELKKTEAEAASADATASAAEDNLEAANASGGIDLGPIDVRLRPW